MSDILEYKLMNVSDWVFFKSPDTAINKSCWQSRRFHLTDSNGDTLVAEAIAFYANEKVDGKCIIYGLETGPKVREILTEEQSKETFLDIESAKTRIQEIVLEAYGLTMKDVEKASLEDNGVVFHDNSNKATR